MQCKKCGIVFDKIGIKMKIEGYFEMDLEEAVNMLNKVEEDTLDELYDDHSYDMSEDEDRGISITPVCPSCRAELPISVEKVCTELIKDGSVVYNEDDEEYVVPPDREEQAENMRKEKEEKYDEDQIPIRPEDFQF